MFNNTQWTREEIEAQEGVSSKVTQKLSDLNLGERTAEITPCTASVSSVQRPYSLVQNGVHRGQQASLSQWGALLPPPLSDSKTNPCSGLGDLPVTSPTLCDLRRAREPSEP